MDNAIVCSGYENEYQLRGSDKDFETSKQDCLIETFVREPPSVRKVQIKDFGTQKLFLQQILRLKKMIPKQVMTMEEKYLHHCLELIHSSAMGPNSSKFNLVVSGYSNEDPIVGAITGSTSMINLLKNPLLHRLGSSNDEIDIKYSKPRAIEVRESLSTGKQKRRVVAEDQIFGCDPVHKRLVSFARTNSTFSDPSSSCSSSSSSSSSAYRQGMLHCSWNNGVPHYVFSVEDQKEVYATSFSKIESDYIYTFYSTPGKREIEICDESDIVGRMRVSTYFEVCPLDLEIMETRLVLCGTDHQNETGVHATSQSVKRSKGLSKRVSNIFRGSHNRQKTKSIFDGSVAIQDNSLELSEDHYNLELAAIVVKDYIPYAQKKVEVGGWGLKFLKEGGLKHKNVSAVTHSIHCEPCAKNASHHHSSSMDVVVAPGFHGGPRTKNGGPSSLIERWRSGGACDCGGWDINCPLTVLNAGPNNKDGVFGKSNSFEFFKQGCKQSLPVLKVTNVHDGLYYIHYQPSLSALQSLSIAVAIIHSHSPTLKPKVYIEVEL
ncbi:uncharacterized protein [Rutidosis leptorrhynchoides]|uniref:uncharacterized protein n=1 Tax=Rutidosis leptorrhynchoides TaxID=125765 RepID=UPI003A9A1137